MTILKNILASLAALASLFSGLFWHLSAKAALDVSAASGVTPKALKAAHDLATLAIYDNLWAAYGAVVAGVVLTLILFIEINTKPKSCNCGSSGGNSAAS